MRMERCRHTPILPCVSGYLPPHPDPSRPPPDRSPATILLHLLPLHPPSPTGSPQNSCHYKPFERTPLTPLLSQPQQQTCGPTIQGRSTRKRAVKCGQPSSLSHKSSEPCFSFQPPNPTGKTDHLELGQPNCRPLCSFPFSLLCLSLHTALNLQ